MVQPENIRPTYAESFRLFLNATDEKDKITAALAQNGIHHGDHLLDIGAGDGELASRILSQITPASYTGVEQNTDFIPPLSNLGVDVIAGAYPSVDEQLGTAMFDSVLSSYSTPLTSDERRTFVASAFARVAPKGRLNLVSFGTPDQWTDISDEIAELLTIADPADTPTRPVSGNYTEQLQDECRELGTVEARSITSEISAPSREKLLHAIAFIATGGAPYLLQQYYEASDVVSDILVAQAPDNRIIQSHSHIVVHRKQAL